MSKTYGYIRVSSHDQNEDRQCIALRKQNVPRAQIYMDKQSGKDFNRPNYRKLLRKLREGDTLYVLSIDRLGRDYEEIQNQWRILTKKKKIDIVVIDMPLLDTRREKNLLGTFISDMVLQLLSFVAQNERETIRKRQAEGIAAAKARGVKFGRPKIILESDFVQDVHLWRMRHITLTDILAKHNISERTFYRKLREIHTTEQKFVG